MRALAVALAAIVAVEAAAIAHLLAVVGAAWYRYGDSAWAAVARWIVRSLAP